MNLLSSKSGWNVERISQGHNVVGTVLRLAPCREILDVQRSALGQALPVVGGGRHCLDLFAMSGKTWCDSWHKQRSDSSLL